MSENLIAKCTMWGVLLSASLAAATPPQATDNTRSPHGDLNISCQNCHTVYGWKPIRAVPEFDHNTQTKFPLRGLHEGVSCVGCHTKMVFSNVGSKCADCHADIHRGQNGAACERCHTVRGWKVSITQINMHTNRFPLTGAHAAAACEDCHKNGALSNFTATSTECMSCHQKDFNSTTSPSHTATPGFSTTPCQSCHNTDSWMGAKFDHATVGFPLTGQHAVPPRACTDCHNAANGGFNITTTACQTCHQADYNNTTNPAHAQMPQAFPIATCQNCHTNFVAWQPANFPNHALTVFPLTGAHLAVPCAQCHVNNNYSTVTTDCYGCHQNDYNTATTPVNHIVANFPTTCATCHDTVAWADGKFNHSATGFALTNAHAVPPRACTDCHNAALGGYKIASAACVNCHQTDYNNTNNPPHGASGFPTTCEVCHDTVAWTDAVFNHNNTAFPLQGAHTTVPCANCHVNNNYTTLPTDCYGCHQTDYNNTTNPNHKSAGFPTTCVSCHTTWVTTNWLGAVFNHTWFPMTHGNANGVCATCHTNANDYTVFQCTGCHGNNNAANFSHPTVSGYAYTSVRCYQCHPNGSGG